jgi:hypothetical protein
MKRGSCPFYDKALRAQQWGAIGVIIGDHEVEQVRRM